MKRNTDGDFTDGDFSSWVMSHKARVISISSSPVFSVMVFLFDRYPTIIDSLKTRGGLALWHGIQVVLILILFGYTCLIKPRVSSKCPDSSEAVKDFYHLLFCLWALWMLLYVLLTINALDPFNIRQELFKNAKAAQIALTATETDKQGQELRELMRGENAEKNLEALKKASKLAGKYHGPEIDKNNLSLKDSMAKFESSQTASLLKASEGIINFVNNLQSLAILLLFWVLAYPRDPKKFFQILMVFLAGILIYFVIELSLEFSGVVVGIFGGIAMALWVGRLDSKFLMAPILGILALYFYAIIQVTWFVYQYDDEKILIITGLAMFLKVIVYLMCSWLLESGKLLYFFEEMRLLYGLSKETEASPMYGKTEVKERFQAFLDDLPTIERSNGEKVSSQKRIKARAKRGRYIRQPGSR